MEHLRDGDLDKRCSRALEQVAVFGISDVRLRPGTIAHVLGGRAQVTSEHEEEPPGRPLIARLIAPKGLAIRLYLTALYDAQVRQRPGSAHTNDRLIWPPSVDDVGWVGLLAVAATVSAKGRSEMDNRVRQVKSAIDRLAREHAVILPRKFQPRNRFENFLLRNDGGVSPGLPSENSYITPRRNEGISIPVEFFTNNWVHCLTDSEIALWISFRLLASEHPLAHKESGVFMAGSQRRYRFGLTRDAYEAHIALRRFGLIVGVENARRWQAGRKEHLREQGLVEPLRFRIDDRMLKAPATQVIGRALRSCFH